MIKGSVNAELEVVVRLTVRGPYGERTRIETIVDTGYDGSLSLPPDAISELGLPWCRRDEAFLADGSICIFDVYEATVIWNRRRLIVPVDGADTSPLLGTALLDGHILNAEFKPGGAVTIRPLRRRRRG